MDIRYVVAGSLAREYILPAVGLPMLDVPGGEALYGCGGLLVWEERVGLLARVDEGYPRGWLRQLEGQGVDTSGVSILEQPADVRRFFAYDAHLRVSRGSAVAQFARRGLPFPKSLLGYRPPEEMTLDQRKANPLSPSPMEMPPSYREALAAHLCPLDLASHLQLASAFHAASTTTLTVDPSASYMIPDSLRSLRPLLAGATAFLPSEEELRSLFWGQTYDLWEMLAAIGTYGCEIVVAKRGREGQAVLDVLGKHRWEVPAYPARMADPTGAGDAFCGGFLAGLKKTYDPLRAALHGNVAASLAIEGTGALYTLDVAPGLAEARLDALTDLVREV
ncbi:MAG: carbohydrate kinase family protein [Anaerolineae bacterium]